MQLGQIADDPDNPYKSTPMSVVGSDEHLKIAREIAQKGAILLKNDPVDGAPVLPLQSGKIKQVIVAGPYANAAFLGHYSGTPTHKTVTPLEGLRAAAGDLKITMHRFAGDQAQTIPSSVLLPPPGEEAQGGLKGEYIRGNDLIAAPEAVRMDPSIDFTWKRPISNVDPLIPGEKFSVRWTGSLMPDISGTYRLAIKPKSSMRVWLDGKKIIDTWETGEEQKEPVESDEMDLEAGKTYEIKVEYFTPGKYRSEAYLGWTLPRDYDADFFAAGAVPESDSTLVVYVGGFNTATAGEFADYPDLSMPTDQLNDLKRWVKRYQNIALVLNGGTIITEPWLFENLPAVLETWYAGQEGGHALADLILGKVSPSGRLPLTWHASDKDLPDLDDYTIHTGRTYMYNQKPVQFPFGHGLSYTTFEYGTPRLSKATITANDTLTVKVPVRNTGGRAAEEVVQLYVRDLESAVYQPKKKLAAFGRVFVKPGETAVLTLEIPAKRLAWWDTDKQSFRIEPGEFELQIGASSDDIRQTTRFMASP
jgi:beta-glucosidase